MAIAPVPRRYSKREQRSWPGRFVPLFWMELDQRHWQVRELKRRVKKLIEEVEEAQGCKVGYAQKTLCERAAFLSIQIETLEAEILAGESDQVGVLNQATNNYQGLLAKLGLTETGKQLKAKRKHQPLRERVR